MLEGSPEEMIDTLVRNCGTEMYIKVKRELCTGCEACVQSCPYDAIVMKEEKAEITELCQLCRACLSVCPEGAISRSGRLLIQRRLHRAGGMGLCRTARRKNRRRFL